MIYKDPVKDQSSIIYLTVIAYYYEKQHCAF